MYNKFPIYSNGTNTLTLPSTGYSSITDGRIVTLGTVINFDSDVADEISNVNFRGIKFTLPIRVSFAYCKGLIFTYCEFEATTPLYQTVTIWNSRYSGLSYRSFDQSCVGIHLR